MLRRLERKKAGLLSAAVAEEFAANWHIVLCCGLGFGVGFALYGYIASTLIVSLTAEFGWTRAQISVATFGYAAAAIVVPFVGMLIDKTGARRVAVASFVLMAACYLALTGITGDIRLYGTGIFLALILGCGTGPIAFARVVARRFVHGRGLALGLVVAGGSLVPMFVAPLSSELVGAFGWRAGFTLLAGLALFGGVPLSLYALREPVRKALAASPADGMTFPEARRDWRLWLLLFCMILTGAPVSGLLNQLQPFLTERGISPATAALGISLISLSILLGRLVTGYLLDRLFAPYVAAGMLVVAAAGSVILAIPSSPVWLLMLGILLIGQAQGAELDVLSYTVARYFGMRAYASIYALIYIGAVLAIPAGSMAFAAIHDRWKSYQLALWLACGVLLVCAALFSRLGAYRFAGPETSLRPYCDEGRGA
jgi:predicted MFS family arabinose efflux permease